MDSSSSTNATELVHDASGEIPLLGTSLSSTASIDSGSTPETAAAFAAPTPTPPSSGITPLLTDSGSVAAATASIPAPIDSGRPGTPPPRNSNEDPQSFAELMELVHGPVSPEPEGYAHPSELEEVNDLIAGLGDPDTWFVTEEHAGYALHAMQQVAGWAWAYRRDLEESIEIASRVAAAAATAAAVAASAAAAALPSLETPPDPGVSPRRSPRGWSAANGLRAGRELRLPSPERDDNDNVV